jgi:signal peptidase I
VVELFKIPSGSMTPTLIGTSSNEKVIEWDVNGDGEKDLILDRLRGLGRTRYHVFYRKNGKFVRPNEERNDLRLPLEVQMDGRMRNDRIIVNKFIYWLHPPKRGDIVVFRVPPAEYERSKPIFIKRMVGLPGEHLEIHPPDLYINGEKVTTPTIFQRIEYTRDGRIHDIDIPDGQYFLMGDNSKNSRDSRYWGTVGEANLRGLAFFRYFPLNKMGFLE